MIIDAYHSKIAPIGLTDPMKVITILQSLKAFIDDVVLHATDVTNGPPNDLILTAQNQLRWWNQLVQVTGGALNPKKCCGMLYQWTPDTKGILRLSRSDDTRHPITLSDAHPENDVHILPPHESTRYLGLYLTTDRNTKPMEAHLWNKAILYTQAFQRTSMNHREAGVLYRSCFLPALSYPLLAVWLPDQFFAKIHRLSTSTILNKMGYHRSLPRTLVFAPRALGGVGLSNLQYEMETQQVLILVRHLRANTQLGCTMEMLICQYQMWAGFQQHILTNTSPCVWIPDRWISRIRKTLDQYHIQIKYDAWTFPPLRAHDVYVMEAVGELGLTKLQLEQINACRMFLQITTLAEMTDHTGCYLLPHAFLQQQHDKPLGLDSLSQSTLIWPEIHNPTKATWKLWTKTICTLFTGDSKGMQLRHPLGAWTADFQKYREWKWRMPSDDRVLNRQSPTTIPRIGILIKSQR